LSNVVFYFKGQRASGLFDEADRHLLLPGGKGGSVDLHGGWYDATGDYGNSSLASESNLVFQSAAGAASGLEPAQELQTLWWRGATDNFSEYERRMLDEGIYGADFLVRMKRAERLFLRDDLRAREREARQGSPHRQIPTGARRSRRRPPTRPKRSLEPTARMRTKRASVPAEGMAVAALALASTMPIDGDFKRAEYLKAAEEAFQFLSAHNRELINDGRENIP